MPDTTIGPAVGPADASELVPARAARSSLIGHRMRYFGSKASSLHALSALIGPPPRSGTSTFCDPFGGLGVVGSHFRSMGYRVTSGDVLRFAHLFQVNRLMQSRRPILSELGELTGGVDPIDFLRRSPPVRSWITKEFAEKRSFFTLSNAKRIDGVRRVLDRWSRSGVMSPAQEAYLYAALIDSADRVANTAGTYYAFLKHWTPRALKEFELRPIPRVHGPRGTALLDDAATVTTSRHWHVLYLDPPYNERDHARYYHLPETIATRRPHQATGLSGAPHRAHPRSRFTTRAVATQELADLIGRASFDRLVVHYSDNGVIESDDLRDMLSGFGTLRESQLETIGYRTSSGPRAVQQSIYTVQ